MMDAKEIFCDWTECTAPASLGVLPERAYKESGAGRQKFIEIFSDGGFTSASDVVTFELRTGASSPGTTKVMAPLLLISAAELSVAGQKAKVPLPSIGLDKFISLYFAAESNLAAGGKVKAILTIDG